MTPAQFLKKLDPVHSRRPQPPLAQRDAFNADLPGYIVFHAIFGYVLLGVGLVAIILRLPPKQIQRKRWLHSYAGYAWVFGTVWMGITAIWCVHSFIGWDIIAFFIFSMYGAIQLGWVFIKSYRRKTSHQDILGALSGADQAGTTNTAKSSMKVKIWKWLHGTAMIYSFIMLLGAGISFPFRAVEDYGKQ